MGPEDSEWMASLDQWLWDCADVPGGLRPSCIDFEGDEEIEHAWQEAEDAHYAAIDALYDMGRDE